MLLTSNATISGIRNETLLDQNNCNNSLVDSTAERISKLCAYCVILLGSFLGNIFIIIIVYKHRDLHKTVNYFIVNMAVSDLLFPISVIPVDITRLMTDSLHWHVRRMLGSILCSSYKFFRDVSIHVSTESLAWIAGDRFVVVVFPIKVGRISPKIRTIAVSSTWIFAAVLNIPWLLTSKLTERGNNTFCVVTFKRPVFPNQEFIAAYHWLHVIFASIAPLFVITVLYSAIAIALTRQNKVLAKTAPSLQRHALKKRRQATQMAVVIVVLFFICVIPLTVVYFLSHLRPSCAFLRPSFTFIATFALYSSSVVNPVICLSFVGSYRRGLKNVLWSFGRERNNMVTKCEQLNNSSENKTYSQ